MFRHGDMGIISAWRLQEWADNTASENYTLLFLCVFVTVSAGLMSGLTLGLMSLDLTQIQVLLRSGTAQEKKAARKIMPVIENQHHLLVTLLLCNAVAMSTLPLFLDRLADPVTALVVSVTAVLLFGEIIPQALCVKYGLLIGARLAWLVRLLMALTCPVSWTLGKLIDLVLGKHTNSLFRRQQLKALVDVHGEATGLGGKLSLDEIKVITGALDLNSKLAYKSMTPLDSVVMLSTDDRLDQETLAALLEYGHSRIPVHRAGNRSDLVGLVFVKELLQYKGSRDLPVSRVKMRSLPRLPANTPMYDCLRLFSTGRSHMAVITQPIYSDDESSSSDEDENDNNNHQVVKEYEDGESGGQVGAAGSQQHSTHNSRHSSQQHLDQQHATGAKCAHSARSKSHTPRHGGSSRPSHHTPKEGEVSAAESHVALIEAMAEAAIEAAENEMDPEAAAESRSIHGCIASPCSTSYGSGFLGASEQHGQLKQQHARKAPASKQQRQGSTGDSPPPLQQGHSRLQSDTQSGTSHAHPAATSTSQHDLQEPTGSTAVATPFKDLHDIDNLSGVGIPVLNTLRQDSFGTDFVPGSSLPTTLPSSTATPFDRPTAVSLSLARRSFLPLPSEVKRASKSQEDLQAEVARRLSMNLDQDFKVEYDDDDDEEVVIDDDDDMGLEGDSGASDDENGSTKKKQSDESGLLRKQSSRRRKHHKTRVPRLGEPGEPIGIITLEDVIEELIRAEIVDETDLYVDNTHHVRAEQAVLAAALPERLRQVVAGMDAGLINVTVRRTQSRAVNLGGSASLTTPLLLQQQSVGGALDGVNFV